MKNRALLTALALLSLPLIFGPPSYAQAPPTIPTSDSGQLSSCDKQGEQSVVLYDQPAFRGRAKYFGVGGCRLFNEADFNDLASSIKVPKGMAAVVYEHADEGGGFGEWVDFLEDQSDLSTYRFDKKISYVEVFPITRGPLVYVRNKIENGRFVKGVWVAGGESGSPNPVVAPFKPTNMPEITSFEAEPTLINQGQSTTLRWQTNGELVRIGERYPMSGQDGPQSISWQEFVHPSGTAQKNPAQPTIYVLEAKKGDKVTTKNVQVDIRRTVPTFCSISGRIIGNGPQYGTFVELQRADTNEVVQQRTVLGLGFRFERVPVGTYRIVPKARRFPMNWGFLPKSDGVTCRPNVPYSLQFKVHIYPEG